MERGKKKKEDENGFLYKPMRWVECVIRFVCSLCVTLVVHPRDRADRKFRVEYTRTANFYISNISIPLPVPPVFNHHLPRRRFHLGTQPPAPDLTVPHRRHAPPLLLRTGCCPASPPQALRRPAGFPRRSPCCFVVGMRGCSRRRAGRTKREGGNGGTTTTVTSGAGSGDAGRGAEKCGWSQDRGGGRREAERGWSVLVWC